MEHSVDKEKYKGTETENSEVKTESEGLFLSPKEALEYCNFKREKFRAEAVRTVSATTVDLRFIKTGEEEQKELLESLRFNVQTVTVTSGRLPVILPLLKGATVADVWVGGDGRAHFKTKLFEMKTAIKAGAKEITFTPDPVLVAEEKFSELKKRLKFVKRKAKNIPLKIAVQQGNDGSIEKLCKVATDCGIGISVPYFKDVEKWKSGLLNGAFLQVTGVSDIPTFKRLRQFGVDRIGATDLLNIYETLLKEAEECALSVPINGAGGKDLCRLEAAALYRAVLKDEI
jgi:deoxyribose-phosphate aldolase